jgi:diguanylate cyclase (GGDEF)-like protein/PAS domain S-box-containing protein
VAYIIILLQKAKQTAVELAYKTMIQNAQSNTSSEGMLAVNQAGQILSFNKRFGEMWRIPQPILDSRDNQKLLDFISSQLKYPEEFKRSVLYLYQHPEKKSEDEIELLDERHFEQYSSPLTGEQGDYLGRIWFFEDMTLRRILLTKVVESEEQVRHLLNSTAEAIYGINAQGNCTFVNPACLQILGYATAQPLIGRNMHSLIHHTHADGRPMPEAECQIFKAVRDGRETHQDTEIFWKADGTSFAAEYWAHPQTVDGQLVGAVITFFDITNRKRVEMALRVSEERYRQLADQSRTVVWEVDPTGLYTYVSDAATKIWGYRPHELVGYLHFYDLHPEEGRAEFKAAAFEIFSQKGSFYNLENAMDTLDGRRIWVSTNGLPRLGPDGELLGYRGADTDITERKQIESLLVVERRRISDILESTHVGTWEWQVQTGETVFNERWAEIIGYTLAELDPTEIDTWARFVHPDDLNESNALLQKNLRKETPYYECDVRMRHKTGKWVWVHVRGKTVTWSPDGRPLLICGTHQDITDRKLAEEQIRHMATHDGLTDLPSLKLAEDRLAMAVSTAHRNHKMAAALFIDLDGFKAVNDTFGHEAGDLVLKEVARRLRTRVRETDTVARIGGDEFLVILPDLQTRENASAVAETIIRLLSQPILINERPVTIGASIGIALYPVDAQDVQSLIKLADNAMYQIKNSGKNGYAFVQIAP